MSNNIVVPKQQIDDLVEDVVKAVKASGGTGKILFVGTDFRDIKGGDHVGIMEELGRKYRIERDENKNNVYVQSGIQFGDGWWATLEYNQYRNQHRLFAPIGFTSANNLCRMPLPYMCEDEIVEQLDWYGFGVEYDKIGINSVKPMSFCPKYQARVDFFNDDGPAQILWFHSPSFFDEDNRRDMVDIMKAYAERKDKKFVEGCVDEWKF